MRFACLVLLLSSAAACSVSTTPDAGEDASTDAGACPPSMPASGATCDVPPSVRCDYAPSCARCAAALYAVQTPTCSCNAGHWMCPHLDCHACFAGAFRDATCTTPCTTDAGVDASATFACGTTACARDTEYCLVTTGGPAPGSIGYDCRPAPAGCVPADCDCLMFDGGGGGAGTSCTDDDLGATTAMLGLP